MSKEEQLGKLAYDKFLVEWNRSQLIISPQYLWRDLPENQQAAWIAAAKAVAEHVMQESQTGEEASE